MKKKTMRISPSRKISPVLGKNCGKYGVEMGRSGCLCGAGVVFGQKCYMNNLVEVDAEA